MSSVIATGGTGKERLKLSTSVPVMRPTSLRDGAFSSRLMVGWEHRSRPLSCVRSTASLNSGSPRNASQSSASSYPQAIANMQNYSMTESVWTTRSRSRYSRMQPANVSASPSLRSAARSSGRPQSDETDPPATAVTFLRLTAGRSNGRRVSSVIAAGRFRCFGKVRPETNFYPTTYATSATTPCRRDELIGLYMSRSVNKPRLRNALKKMRRIPFERNDPYNLATAHLETLEFLAMVSGLKPVVLIGRGFDDLKWIRGVRRISEEMRLHVHQGPKWEAEPEFNGLPKWYASIEKGNVSKESVLYVCKSPSISRSIIRICNSGDISVEEESSLLGYPLCCVQDHYFRNRMMKKGFRLMLSRVSNGDKSEMNAAC